VCGPRRSGDVYGPAGPAREHVPGLQDLSFT